MTYLPWAGSLQSDSVNDPADAHRAGSVHGSRARSPSSPRDGDGYARPDPPDPLDAPDPRDPLDALDAAARQARLDRDGQFPAEIRADPGAIGQEISNRLFSVGCDLHFALMTLREGPGKRRLGHAIHEIDDALRDLRHLMLAITEQLA